ncbi:MAG: RluA family pseudouridine synthase [Planctomycetota bacterium]
MVQYYPVPEERVGLELDEFLCLLYPGVSKGFLRQAIRDGDIEVVGEETICGRHLRFSDVIAVHLDEDELPRRRRGKVLDVELVYEDANCLVANKPAGIAVEPERWSPELGCFLEEMEHWAAARAQAEADRFRPRLVHRLDKDTSGCLLFAKDLESERHLRRCFEAQTVRKAYLALVEGEFPLEDGERTLIDQPLGPDPRKAGRMQIVADGRPSQTEVWVEERFAGYTLVGCAPRTGRTHQIRVHLAYEGFPLVVDPLYGRRDKLLLSEIKSGYRHKQGSEERPLMPRLTLHAWRLSWPSQDPNAPAPEVEAPLPKDLRTTLKQFAKVRPFRR